jgi:iron complex transport system ATP-binding protein
MKPIVEVEGVTFRYRGEPVLREVSVAVPEGELLGVVGPNSSGKTTLLRLLSRVLAPEAGTIRLGGRNLQGLRRAEVARSVAVVPQELAVAFPYTALQVVLMGRHPHAPGAFFETASDLAVALEAMKAAGVDDLRDQPLDQVSGGERQRIVIAKALAQRPRLLLLDEPTAHLDLAHQVEILRLFRRLHRDEGMTIVLVSHDVTMAAACCDRLLLLSRGRVAALGSPADVVTAERIAEVYGCRVEVEQDPVTRRPRLHPERLLGDLGGGKRQEAQGA